jgi:hypothetical protein
MRAEDPESRREREEIPNPAKLTLLKPIAAETLLGIVEGYIRNGMDYREPTSCPEYVKLAESIKGPTVESTPLHKYAEWTRAILNAPMDVQAAQRAIIKQWELRTDGQASSLILKVRNPSDFLMVTFALLLRPSMTPLEKALRARK